MGDTEDYSEEATPSAHHESHEAGGDDEISLDALQVDAQYVEPDTTNFDGILSPADDTDQKALDTIDDHGHDQLHDKNYDQFLDLDGPNEWSASDLTEMAIKADAAYALRHAQIHAAEHVTGGGDVVANAVAAGNAGLMTGADKTKLNNIDAGADVTGANAPKAHAPSHTDGSDDIQNATAAQKGLMTLAQAGKLAGIAAGADVTGANAPKAHAASHKSGGADSIKLDELAAPTDIATLNSDTSKHGLLKKLDDDDTHFMDGKGNWTEPAGTGAGLVDRGDPDAFDWDVNDFITDATWRELDCSSIVPAGAIAILFQLLLRDGATSSYFNLRKNGNTNAVNISYSTTQAVDTYYGADLTCHCDANRKVEYRGKSLTFTSIYLTVKGWYL